MWHLVKVVHIQLADKGGEQIVLEELWQYLLCEPDLIRDYLSGMKKKEFGEGQHTLL
jgi:hypothetical protein